MHLPNLSLLLVDLIDHFFIAMHFVTFSYCDNFLSRIGTVIYAKSLFYLHQLIILEKH